MTKRKKTIIIFISVICLCSILLLVFWSVPVLRWQVFGVPIETDQFLPEPDSIAGYYANQEVIFSEERQNTIYNAFLQLMPHLTKTESIQYYDKSSVIDKAFCLEFRYKHRYSYINSDALITNTPFDAVFCVLYDDGTMSAIALLEGEKNDSKGVRLTFEEDFAQFQETVKIALGNSLPHPMGVPQEAVGTTVIETSKFLDFPASMVFAEDGESFKLSEEQKNQIHTAFLKMEEVRAGYIRGPANVVKSQYTLENLYEDMVNNPCLEFRYDRRYRFSGTVIQYDPLPIEDLPEQEITYVKKTLEYDSIIIVLMPNGVRIAIGCGGLYESIGGGTNGLYGLGDGYPAFRNEVLSLTQ